MIQVGELMIKMGADVAQLRTDMAESKAVVKGAMADVSAAVGVAKTAFIALTGIASAGAFVGMISGAIEAKARLYDLSLITGATVESLSALQRIGKLSRTSIDDIAQASVRLSKNLVGSTEESKGAAQAVAALGLNFQQLKALSPDQQMLALARAFDNFAEGAGKSAGAVLLFGKAGASLLPFMKELGQATELVGRETTASALEAKRFEENLIKLQSASSEWRRQLVSDMLPTLSDMSQRLVDNTKEHGKLFGLLSTGADLYNRLIGSSATWNGMLAAKELVDAQKRVRGLAESQKELLEWSKTGPFGEYYAGKLVDINAELVKARANLRDVTMRVKGSFEGDGGYTKGGAGRGVVNLPFTPGKPQLDIKEPEKESDFDRLLARIRERVALEQQEADAGRELTSVEKLQADAYAALDGKLSGVSVQKKLVADAELQLGLALEKGNIARKSAAVLAQQRDRELQSEHDRLHALSDVVRAQRDATEEVGLYGDELDRLRVARLLDAAAAVRQKAADMELFDAQSPLIQVIKDQALAIDARANALVLDAQKRKALSGDSFAGARRGLTDYLSDIRDVNNAAYQLIKGTAGRLEDSLTDFFTTGHFGARKFVDQLIAEFTRLAVVRPLLNSLLGSSFGSGLVSTFGSLFGAGSLTGALDAGSASGPALSVPANFTLGASGGSAIQSAGRQVVQQFDMRTTVNGSNLSPSQLASALAQNTDRTIAKIADMQRRGVSLA